MDNPDTTARSDTHDRSVVDAALSFFSGNLTDDTLAAYLKTLRADPDWRVFVFEGPKVRDMELAATVVEGSSRARGRESPPCAPLASLVCEAIVRGL